MFGISSHSTSLTYPYETNYFTVRVSLVFSNAKKCVFKMIDF